MVPWLFEPGGHAERSTDRWTVGHPWLRAMRNRGQQNSALADRYRIRQLRHGSATLQTFEDEASPERETPDDDDW